MSLDALIARLPAPGEPAGAPFDWPAVEAQLDTVLPADYKRYCDVYGHGTIDVGWSLDPLTPGHPEPMLDLLGTTLLDRLGDALPSRPALFPELGGLLPFASTEHQEVVWWRTGGPPDAWTLVLERDTGELEALAAASATDLLAQTIAGRGPLGAPQVEDPQFWPAASAAAADNDLRPFVVTGSGYGSEGVFINLDLGGALPGSRRELVDAFLASAPRLVRPLILNVQVRRSEEVLQLRHRAAIPIVKAAVQAFADQVDREARR